MVGTAKYSLAKDDYLIKDYLPSLDIKSWQILSCQMAFLDIIFPSDRPPTGHNMFIYQAICMEIETTDI